MSASSRTCVSACATAAGLAADSALHYTIMAKAQDTTENDEWPKEYRQRIAECENPEKPYKDKELLKDLYCYRELSSVTVGEILDCSPTTVMRYVREYNLPEGTSRLGPAKFYMHRQGYIHVKSENDIAQMHRLTAVAKYGFDAVCGMQVHHKNDVPWDNRPENLELMTLADHTAHHSSKVSWLEKIRMAEMYEHGDISHRDLAEVFDVSMGTTIRYHHEFYGK